MWRKWLISSKRTVLVLYFWHFAKEEVKVEIKVEPVVKVEHVEEMMDIKQEDSNVGHFVKTGVFTILFMELE
jgi:hypothetical protein